MPLGFNCLSSAPINTLPIRVFMSLSGRIFAINKFLQGFIWLGFETLEQLFPAEFDPGLPVVHEDVRRSEGVVEIVGDEGAGADHVERRAGVREHLALEEV